eukprot:gene14343-19236_t
MNLANQKQVVQTANMQLVAIRNAEISYFTSFYSSFGTQAAILVGVICGAISQTPGYDTTTDTYFNPNCPYFFVYLYNVTSTSTLIFNMHVWLCSVLIVVYGQGLALRGPVGSMVSAIEGMVIEQKQILLAFVLGIVSFVLSVIGMYFIVMDIFNAIASSVIATIGIIYTYHVSLRIYNRFKYTTDTDWNDEKKSSDADNDDMDSDYKQPTPSASVDKSNQNDPSMSGHIKSMFRGNSKNKGFDNTTQSVDHKTSSELLTSVSSGTTTASNQTDPFVGGYLTVKTSKAFLDPWERRYIVIRKSNIYFYQDKRAHQLEPSKPINKRPIDMEGYSLVAGSMEPPFAITLVPIDPDDIRKAWKFRCDTSSEFSEWVNHFSKALQSLDKGLGGTQNDLVTFS